jgi:hypothetical protein
MARAKPNGDARLEESVTALNQSAAVLNQAMATLVQNQAAFQGQMREMDRVNSERFARIESILIDHSRVLAEHSRVLNDLTGFIHTLPDAIKEKIGFKGSA